MQAGEIHGDVHFHQGADGRVVPRQLPAVARHFVNRAVERDALTTLLGGSQSEGFVVISTVDGIAGVGKSTLAVRWAHDMRDRFPDGELYVNLRGFDPAAEPVKPTEALAGFLSNMGISSDRMPQDEEARAALFRSLVHDKRMLILLDNARTADQVRPLLPSSPSCLVLVTSRNRLHELVVREGALRVALEVLSNSESEHLLSHYLGEQRVSAEADAVGELVRHCAGLPLALGIAAVRAAENPDFPLDELVSELQNERDRLDALDAGGETGVRAVFSWSYRSLSPEAARMFRLLGLPTGPDISLAAAADLAGVPQREARALLVELARANLVDQHKPGRYQFHDLIRAYAAERAATDETPEDRQAAIRRLLDHYLRTSQAIDRKLTGHIRLFAPEPPPSTVRGLSFGSENEMFDWWDAEYANLLASIQLAVHAESWSHAWQIPYTMLYFFKLRSRTEDWSTSYEIAIDAARRLEDEVAEANLCISFPFKMGDGSDRVLVHVDRARELFARVGDMRGVGLAIVGLGELYLDRERLDEAMDFLERGVELQHQVGDDLGEGYGHANLGKLHLARQQWEMARAHLAKALVLYRKAGEKFGEGIVANDLAGVHLAVGEDHEAVSAYRDAVEFRRVLGDLRGEAESLHGLGLALRNVDDFEGSRGSLQQALAIYEDLGDAAAEAVKAEIYSGS